MKKHFVSPRREETPSDRFDPFNHRLSRDIRNSMAEAFVDALPAVDKSLYQRTADQWFARNLAEAYADYIQNRLKRYGHVLNQIQLNRIYDVKRQVLIIWNQGLFFEFHELLERIWLKTKGDEYQALKGLIQAAGVYIHLEFDHLPAAQKLAVKSSDRIQKYAYCLPFIGNLDMLLERLNNLDSAPPRLKRSGT